jgi:hypothetical protein
MLIGELEADEIQIGQRKVGAAPVARLRACAQALGGCLQGRGNERDFSVLHEHFMTERFAANTVFKTNSPVPFL